MAPILLIGYHECDMRSSWLIAAAAGFLCATGCPSPTLPLPPPSAEASPPSAAGIVSVTGQALEEAYVACLNEDLERGVIVRANGNGNFSLEINGQTGNKLTVWQIRGSESGNFAYLEVPAP